MYVYIHNMYMYMCKHKYKCMCTVYMYIYIYIHVHMDISIARPLPILYHFLRVDRLSPEVVQATSDNAGLAACQALNMVFLGLGFA